MDIALTKLDAEIHWTSADNGAVRVQILWFYFRDRHYGIPFSKTGKNLPPHFNTVWKHVSGDTIEDITLSPSYWVKKPPEYAIHVHVQNGIVTGLPG